MPLVALGRSHPRFAGWGLAVAEAWLDGPREVAVVGDAEDPRTVALARAARRGTAAGAVVVVGPPPSGTRGDGEVDEPGSPLLAGRTLVGGVPAAYVCRFLVCDAPVTDPSVVALLLTRDVVQPPAD